MASLSNHQTTPSINVPYELRSPLSGVRKNLPGPVDMGLKGRSPSNPKISDGVAGYVLEDVPHLTDYISDLPTYLNPLQDNPAYSVVKQYFVNTDDSVAHKIVVHKDSPRGVHFRRAGPRQKVYFESDEVNACIVTCGGLCPGLNTIIREIVCGLSHMYGVTSILGIEWGYMGFYARNTIPLTPKSVNDIHKRGGTVLGTSRGGHDTTKIVDSIEDRGINQVYIIGGDGSQKGASVIFEEIQRRGLKVAVAGIPKTIDNDIPVIDKSFGFDSAVEEAQRAINAAHVEAGSVENGIGVVKLMGRYSGSLQVLCHINREGTIPLEREGSTHNPTPLLHGSPSSAASHGCPPSSTSPQHHPAATSHHIDIPTIGSPNTTTTTPSHLLHRRIYPPITTVDDRHPEASSSIGSSPPPCAELV